jgi:hypothetical protein
MSFDSLLIRYITRKRRRRLDEGKPDDMLDYIKAYADSKAGSDENDSCSKNAMKLYSYLKNNYNGLLPYQK